MWTWLISVNRYRPLTDGQGWSEETGWPGTCQAGSLPACPTWAPGRVQHPSILTPPGSPLFLGIKHPTEVRRLLSEEVGFEDGQPAFRNHRATCRRKQGRGAGGGDAPPHPQPTLEAITQQRAGLPGCPRQLTTGCVSYTQERMYAGATLSAHSGVRGFLRFQLLRHTDRHGVTAR